MYFAQLNWPPNFFKFSLFTPALTTNQRFVNWHLETNLLLLICCTWSCCCIQLRQSVTHLFRCFAFNCLMSWSSFIDLAIRVYILRFYTMVSLSVCFVDLSIDRRLSIHLIKTHTCVGRQLVKEMCVLVMMKCIQYHCIGIGIWI